MVKKSLKWSKSGHKTYLLCHPVYYYLSNLVLVEHNDNRSCSLLFIGKQKKMNFSYAHYQAAAAAFLRVHPILSLSAGGQYMHFVFAYYHHQDHCSDRPTPSSASGIIFKSRVVKLANLMMLWVTLENCNTVVKNRGILRLQKIEQCKKPQLF